MRNSPSGKTNSNIYEIVEIAENSKTFKGIKPWQINSWATVTPVKF
jgi:hypothetical protein